MVADVGNNRNFNDVAVTSELVLNDVNATVIAPANDDRIFFEVWLVSGATNVIAHVRLYPAAIDNIKKGVTLIRNTMGNINQFIPLWRMPIDNIYTGEISAIAELGNIDIIVIEY